MQCPKCGSSNVKKREYNKKLQRLGGFLASTAGVTAGTVGGAASGASVGAAIGTMAGPLGVIVGGTVGTFVGAISVAITGGVVGNMVGKKAAAVIDQNLFLDYQCTDCQHRFEEKEQTAQIQSKDDDQAS